MSVNQGYCPEVWDFFIKQEQVLPEQAILFNTYLHFLLEWNTRKNLTSVTEPDDVIHYHFRDSLSVARFYNFNTCKSIADIGSGGGFPGIPLKIMFPHLQVILIEVNQKKIIFLQELIKVLGLSGVEVVSDDWRTFMHKAEYNVDLFLARASLRPDELVPVFKTGLAYKKATVVYYASRLWQMGAVERPFFVKEHEYVVGDRTRRLVFFTAKGA